MTDYVKKILIGSSLIAGSIAAGEALKLEKRFTGAFDRLTEKPEKKTSKKGKVFFFSNNKERRCAR